MNNYLDCSMLDTTYHVHFGDLGTCQNHLRPKWQSPSLDNPELGCKVQNAQHILIPNQQNRYIFIDSQNDIYIYLSIYWPFLTRDFNRRPWC